MRRRSETNLRGYSARDKMAEAAELEKVRIYCVFVTLCYTVLHCVTLCCSLLHCVALCYFLVRFLC